MRYVINWQHRPGVKAYLTKGSPSRKPYAITSTDPDVQTWKTRDNAIRFLSRKDRSFASECVIEEVEDV